MSRPRAGTRTGLRMAVLLGVLAASTATTTAVTRPVEAHVRHCGHGTHYDLRHPHYRMEFVAQFDRRGRHYHRVLFHRQLLGLEDWTTTIRCDQEH